MHVRLSRLESAHPRSLLTNCLPNRRPYRETMSVCHCKYSAQTPGKYTQTVDHYKWLEPRRMTSVRDRWSFDHTDAFHFATAAGSAAL